MADQPYSAGIKTPVNTESNPASSGFVRTNPYNQTIEKGVVDKMAQDYMEPAEGQQVDSMD